MKFFRIEMDNEFEAEVFTTLLDAENIPHTVINHHNLAYDGLFQVTMGWGHIEIPEGHQEKSAELYRNYKESLPE